MVLHRITNPTTLTGHVGSTPSPSVKLSGECMSWSKRKSHTRKPKKSWQAKIKVKSSTVKRTKKRRKK